MAVEPRSRTTDIRFYGLVPAIVSEIEDPEGLGRVKVSLPWFDSSTELWARVITLYAGSDYGIVWTPEQDTEVVVAFQHGDMRFPYVVGAVFNGVDKPPTQRSSSTDRKVFKTKAGHEIVVDDGEAEIRVSHHDGPKITLSSSKISIEASEIEIKATGTLTVQGQPIKLN